MAFVLMLTAIASLKWGSYSGEPWCRFYLNGVRFPNCSGKAKRTHTVEPSLRAASSVLDRISFRMLVREYCAASSSCSEGMPLYRKYERNFVFQKETPTPQFSPRKKKNKHTEVEKWTVKIATNYWSLQNQIKDQGWWFQELWVWITR